MILGSLHTRSRMFVLVSVLIGMSVTAMPIAHAAPGAAKPGKDPVVELFNSGNKLFAEKKYDAAMLLFRNAYEQSQSPNAHLMIGKCLLALNRLPEAYEELSATVREAGKRAETEAKYADTRDAAATELAPLETKIAKVIVTVVDAPAGVRVRMGGIELAKDKLGTPVATMPGTVEIVAEGLPQGTVTQREEVKGGETKAVVIGKKDADKPPPLDMQPKETPVEKPSVEMTGGGARKAGFAVLGLGAVGMGLFAFGGIQGNSTFAQLEQECGSKRCTDPKYADLINSGKNMDLLANIGLGVGAVGLVAGTIMVIAGGPKPKPKTEASVFVGPGQTMFQVRHAF